MTERPWPSEWLRGVLEVCVLRAMSYGPTYGYAISAQLEEAGLGPIKGGTLYPLLTRFEKAGLVDVQWQAGESGPARKYYSLTSTGRAELESHLVGWSQFADVVGRFLEGDSRPSTHREAKA
jgi:PadR family transcriptional regulator, regulatory protein PadR